MDAMSAIEVHCPVCGADPWYLCRDVGTRFHAARHYEVVSLAEQLDWIEETTDADAFPFGLVVDATPYLITDRITESIGAQMSAVFGAPQ